MTYTVRWVTKFYRLCEIQIFKRGSYEGIIHQKPLKFCMQLFWCRWPNEVIERSVRKQRAHIVMRYEMIFIPNRQMLSKGVMASLGTSAFQWFHMNPRGDVKIASWAVHKYIAEKGG